MVDNGSAMTPRSAQDEAATETVPVRKHRHRLKEPLWPPFLGMPAIGGLFSRLPPSLLGGAPRWLLVVIIICLTVPILLLHYAGNHLTHQILGYILCSIVTLDQKSTRLKS